MARPDTSPIKILLDSVQKLSILLPQHPSYDVVAAGLALKLAFDSQGGKSVFIVCADPMTVEFNRLVGIDTVISSIGSNNLIISFPGQTEHVDKVSYNLDHGELQLIVTPKAGSPTLDHHRLKFSPVGQSADLIVMVGVSQLTDLGPLYTDIKDTLSTTKVIAITHDLPQDNYAHHHLYDPEVSSLSELMVHIIDSLYLNFSADVATNLLSGLENATNTFKSPLVTHTTFESAAHLVKKGANRGHDTVTAGQFPTGSVPTQPYSQTPPVPTPSDKQTPNDWYQPKIYRGPMLQ